MNLTLQKVLQMMGFLIDDIDQYCIDFFNSCNFSCEILSDENYELELFKIIKFLDNETRNVNKNNNLDVWEKSWKRNLESYYSNKSLLSVIPYHFNENEMYWVDKKFVKLKSKNFELNFYKFLTKCLFIKYFKNVDSVYEFGSGSGMNLITLSEMFPNKKIFGLDFSKNAIELINEVSKFNNLNIKSLFFDISNPDYSIKLKNNSAVLTVNSLEQITDDFYNFFLFLLKNKPKVCIHIEPIVELLDETKFTDYLSKRYHNQRGYLKGMLPFLQSLESAGLIEIVKLQRVRWKRAKGTETMNYIVWRIR